MTARPLLRTCILLLAITATLAAQTGSVVTLNQDKVLVLNGRKVFPITFTPGPPNHAKTPLGDDALKELRAAGALAFRIAQTADWDNALIATQRDALDWAQQHGMYCMVNLRERSAFADGDITTEAALRSLVNEFKSHPALAYWKNKDEAWWGDTSAADLKRGYDVIKQEDVNHPVEQTHAPRGTIADLQPYNAAADILAIDIYPVGVPPGSHSLLPNKEISVVGDWTKFLSDVSGGQNGIWMVEQIAWSGVTPPKPLVYPTRRQSRYMAYQAIVNGARGLMFFGGNVASVLNAQDAPLGWNWTFWDEVLEHVIREVGDHSPLAEALVAPNSPLPITFSGAIAPNLEMCVREVPPHIYLIACKREGPPAQVTFSGLPTWAQTGEVLFENGRTVPVSGGQFTDLFEPFDVHVYRFSQIPEGVTIIHPPQSLARYVGTKANFHVFADGTGPLSYQWRKNGIPIVDDDNQSGATSPALTLSSVGASSAGNYDVVVTGTSGAISQPAVLSVLNYAPTQIPSITTQPQSQTVSPGTTVSLKVATSGTGPFGYRWRKNGAELHDGGHIAGATTWCLRLANVSLLDMANYDVIVTGHTSVTSASAALDVVPQINQLILYEPFDYSNIGGPVSANNPGNWTFGGTGADDLSVTPGSLTYPELATSVGNSVTNGGSGLGVRRQLGASVSGGVIFFSALFRINELGTTWSGAASQVGALTAADNVSFRLAVMVQANAPGYRIGVQKGGTGATPTFGTTTLNAGETVFLVGKYDFTPSPNVVSLWVNPAASTYGAQLEPDTGFIVASSGVDGFTIDRFNMRQNTATSVPEAMQWDELRFGGSWADVTPPAPPVVTSLTRLQNGSFRLTYRNPSAQSYSVHASENLVDWLGIGSATELSPGHFEFIDLAAANLIRRFYQLRSP